jgi:hypothetical protein
MFELARSNPEVHVLEMTKLEQRHTFTELKLV